MSQLSSSNLNEKLLAAVRENNLDLVQEYLSCGASLAYSDWAGFTALHLAASGSPKDAHLEICRLLLKYGANTNQLTKLRKSPLHLAVQSGNFHIVEALITTGILEPNSLDILLMTPLHWAVVRSDVSIVDLLVNKNVVCLQTLQMLDKFGRDCFEIARLNQDWLMLSQLEVVESKLLASETNASLNIRRIEEELKNQTGYNMDVNMPGTSSSKHKTIFSGDLDDSDSDNEQRKKKRISSSPVQNIEDTLMWLQRQALATNISDDYLLEDRQFFLTGSFKFIFFRLRLSVIFFCEFRSGCFSS